MGLYGGLVRRLASACALAIATFAFTAAPASAAPTGFTAASCQPPGPTNGFVFFSGGAWAQTFTAGGSGYARTAEIEGAFRHPGDNDDINVYIQATDASGAPTGAGLGHATVPGASVPVGSSYTLTANFPLGDQAYLVDGRTYALTVTSTNSSQDSINQYGSNPCPGSLFVAPGLGGPWNGTFNPDNDWRFMVFRAPANDFFSQPQTIPGTLANVGGSTQWATRQAGEPIHYTPVGGDIPWPGDHSVWYRWLALGSGPTTIQTCTAAIDSILAVYTGDTLGALTRVADNNNACPSGFGSRVTFNAVAGTLYRIAVADAGGARESTFQLVVNGKPNLQPTISNLRPPAGSSIMDTTPTIGATVTDSATELKAGSIKLFLDGTRITGFSYDQATDLLRYTSAPLSLGTHTARVVATDAQGLMRDVSWSFDIVP